MEIDYKDELIRRCFKLPREVIGNLNIKYHESEGNSTLIVLWNTYQIYVYDDLTFETPKLFIPEFNIANLLLSNNYLICLDDNGNIHITPLKFKHSAQKKFKSSFLPREQGIKCIEEFLINKTISLKYMSETFYICVHKISTDFQIDTEIKILFDGLSTPMKQKRPWIFHTYLTRPKEYDQIKDLYKQKDTWKEHAMILISLDGTSVYSILFNSKTSDAIIMNPIKLYTSPSEIANINIIKTDNISVLLSLAIGTIIKVPLINMRNNAQIIHLNTAIYKLFPVEDTMVYCDGSTMWKSEKTFTECIKFKKCLINQVKDFIIIRDRLLCTTFSNLIYLLSFNDVFKELSTDTYCPAEEVLNNFDCLTKIMNEVEKCNEITKKIRKEETYITLLSLSNRYDILDGMIKYNVSVYETFNDIPKEDLTLIDNLREYYNLDTVLFLISIESKSLIEKFNELLSNMFENLKVHLIFGSDSCIKTVSVNVLGELKKINILVPLSIKKINFSKITVEIKLITSITEVFNTNHNVWTILHSKRIILNSEHFIKTYIPNDQIHFINKSENICDTIYDTTLNHFGHLYKFYKFKSETTNWSLYAKLTKGFENLLNNETYLHKCFNARKAAILLKQITSDDFMKSNNEIVFEIGHDKLHLEIINDGFTKPMLRVSSKNIENAYYIRNFLSELVLNNFTDFEAGNIFIDHALYSTVERFAKTVQDAISRLPSSRLEFIKLFEKYQKNVIGRMPL